MQFSYALIALVATGLANAQMPNLPSCSLNCFVQGLAGDGCPSLTDFKCQCQKTGLVAMIAPCIQSSCSPADQAAVLKGVEAECAKVGVPISLPPMSTATSMPSVNPGGPMSCTCMMSVTPTSTLTPVPVQSSTPAPPKSSRPVSTPLASSTPLPSPTFNAAANIQGGLAGVAAAAAAVAYIL